jgi:hypothetical protein
MALAIKNLGRGPLGTTVGDIVPAVSTGKAVLVENVIFVNTSAITTTTITVKFYDASSTTSYEIVTTQSLAPKARWVLPEVTLEAGDKLTGLAANASLVDFLANGMERDI